MRLTVLTCWGVVAALVVAAEGKPYAPPAFDIARAYETYHQLWMSEARRNAVAPKSISQQIARSWPRKQSAVTKVAPPAPVAEKPPQEQLTEGTETEKATVDQNTQESSATEQGSGNQQGTAEQQTPEMTTEAQTRGTMTDEPTTTEPSAQEEVMTEADTQEPTTQQPNVDTKSASKQAPRQPQSITPTARPATDMKAAFDNFFNRWNAERVRNSIPPRATPIPPLSTFYNVKQTKLTKQPVVSKPVDPPVETPANIPTPEASVDTLTKKAAPSAPVATAAAPATDAVSLIKSLAQPDNWGQQGSAPLIIILQQPGAAVPI